MDSEMRLAEMLAVDIGAGDRFHANKENGRTETETKTEAKVRARGKERS